MKHIILISTLIAALITQSALAKNLIPVEFVYAKGCPESITDTISREIGKCIADTGFFIKAPNQSVNRIRFTVLGNQDNMGPITIKRSTIMVELIPGDKDWGLNWWVIEAGSISDGDRFILDKYFVSSLKRDLEVYFSKDGLEFLSTLFDGWSETSWNSLNDSLAKAIVFSKSKSPKIYRVIHEGYFPKIE